MSIVRPGGGGIEGSYVDPTLTQGLKGHHLVLNQRHQGGDHQGEGMGSLGVHQRRQLVGEALAATGGHDQYDIMTRQKCVHGLELMGSVVLQLENFPQGFVHV